MAPGQHKFFCLCYLPAYWCLQVLSQARNVLKQFTEAKVQAAGSDEGAHRASDPRAAQAHIWNMMQV